MVVPGKFFGEEFQRHRATQPGVLGLIDDAHSSLAQLLKDSKMRNGLSDHDWRRSLLLAGHVRPWPLASQTTATPNPWFPLTYCQESVRLISPASGWCCSCECPPKMTMSGNSCGTEALLSKLNCVIGFISGRIGTQRYGLKSATDSAR